MFSQRKGLSASIVALTPLFPPLAWLHLRALPQVGRLPVAWRWLLGAFVGAQLVAALLSPTPAVSFGLAFLRAIYTVALIVAGFVLARPDTLRWAGMGYALVALMAMGTSLLLGEPLQQRLQHPYYTPVSLGLAGSVLVLLAVTASGVWWWRVAGSVLGITTLLWSGSRGPLLALGVGLIAAVAADPKKQWRGVVAAGALALALLLGLQGLSTGGVTSRFAESTLTGRGAFWADTLQAAKAHALGGVGPYQLGPYMSTQYSDTSCQLWIPRPGQSQCRPGLDRIRGAWLMAHNTLFHLVGETGVIGALGWLALMGALTLGTWRSRQPLLAAIIWATTAMGLVDNPTLLPSLGHAELYWLAGGVAIALTSSSSNQPTALASAAPLLTCALLLYWGLPLWLTLMRPLPPAPQGTVIMPPRVMAGERVAVWVYLPEKTTDAVLSSQLCQNTHCRPGPRLYPQAMKPGWQTVSFGPFPAGTYEMQWRWNSQEPGLRLDLPLSQRKQVIDVR